MIMSKTKRTSILHRERQTAIQLEKLEPRQLLATVTGGGEEVGSDISYQGNVYDQVLMQGAAVSVEADPGQIVRVSWIDGNGDITQGEFSGAGTFTVSLDDFRAPAEPENYNQPGVEYASGNASITIEGSNSSSNISVFTVGPTTSANFGALDTGADLDGVADIARITIVADPSQPGGSTFGGIRTANAMYSDDTGVVGIAADGVQVQTTVIIGDIDASNSGIPTLLFGDNSQFGTVQVAGGDLAQSNGEAINDGGFQTVSFIDGMTSDGVSQPAGTFLGAFSSGEQRISALDTSTEINIEGMSQAELDAAFAGKTFTEDLTIVGDLEQYQRISAGEFQKNVTFDGVYAGSITVGTVGGDITFMGTESGRTISSNITAGSLGGSLIFGSDTSAVNYSGTLRTSSMATEAIQVFGDFTGTVTTDGDNDGNFDAGEGALGDIHVSGDFSGNAVGILGIGDITVGGNLTTDGTAFYTSSGSGANNVASVGTLTVMGDVDQDDGDMLIEIASNGSFGAITLMGGGTDVGLISIGGSLLGGDNGDITITGAKTVDVHGIDVNAGTLSHLTVTGDGSKDSAFTLGDIEADAIGNVSVSGFEALSLNAITVRTSGMLDFTGDTTVNGAIMVAHQLGSLTFNGNAAINADITSAWMGPVMIDGDATFADGMGLVSGTGKADSGRLDSFEVTGNTTFNSASGANIELAAGGDFTFGGFVSGTADGAEIVASSLGDLSFTAALTGNGQAIVEDLTIRAIPGAGDKVAKDGSNLGDYSLGDITVESTNTIGIPGASLFAGNNAFHALGAIGNISLLTGGSAIGQTALFSADTDKLLFIVGDTTGDPAGDPTIDFDADGTNDDYGDLKGGTVSIGNVNIDAAPGVASNYDTVGFSGDPDATAAARFTGMNILSGVHAASAEQINAVDDRFDVVELQTAYNTAKTARDAAQTAFDELLGDRDADALFAAVTTAETALGAAAVADDPATDDVDEAKAATGAYLALQTAQEKLDAAEKALTETRDAFDSDTDVNAEITRLKTALGVPALADDPATDDVDETRAATGAYETLADAKTALEADTSTDEGAVTSAKTALASAKTALTAGQEAVTDANADQIAIRRAHSTAEAADDDGTITDAEYRTAYIADINADYDVLSDDDKTADSGTANLGRVAYTENAGVTAAAAAAPGAWNALTLNEKITQGNASYLAASDDNTLLTWNALSSSDKLAAGRAAWIADFIDTTGGLDADTVGDAARTTAETNAGTAFNNLSDAAKIAQGMRAVEIKAGRDADVNLAGFADNAARVTAMSGIITELDAHVTEYESRHRTAVSTLGDPVDGTNPATALYLAVTAAEGDVTAAETALKTAREDENGTYAGLVDDIDKAETALATARTAYFEALADGAGTTTQDDVIAAIAVVTAAQEALGTAADTASDDTAYGGMLAKAKAAVATATAALPAGFAAAKDALAEAQTALDKAETALEAGGAGSLGDDEILMANDADLKGMIGNIDIRNKVTLLSTMEVADITDDLTVSVSVGSASAIAAATDVGSVNGPDSLKASKDGVLVGGTDSMLDENELLVYIV